MRPSASDHGYGIFLRTPCGRIDDNFTANCPDFPAERIFKADYDGTTDKGNVAATSVITAHPEIKKWLVTGANEEGTIGAVRALESAGLDGDACVVGLEGTWQRMSGTVKGLTAPA
ncbi:MAG: hypothetical protein V8R61_08135 [Enterocloster sp.]